MARTTAGSSISAMTRIGPLHGAHVLAVAAAYRPVEHLHPVHEALRSLARKLPGIPAMIQR
jgi:hypothetical protein